MVFAALVGHVLVYRRLLAEAVAAAPAAAPPSAVGA
jgi:hypothetical protein